MTAIRGQIEVLGREDAPSAADVRRVEATTLAEMRRVERLVDDLNARTLVPPSLAMEYVKTRCVLHGFAVARVERGEPIETHDLETRARAEIALRTPAAAA